MGEAPRPSDEDGKTTAEELAVENAVVFVASIIISTAIIAAAVAIIVLGGAALWINYVK